MLVTYPTVYVLELTAEIGNRYHYFKFKKKVTLYFPVSLGLHVRFNGPDFLFEIIDVVFDHRAGVFEATGEADECFPDRAALLKWIEDIGWSDAQLVEETESTHDSNTKIPPATGQAE